MPRRLSTLALAASALAVAGCSAASGLFITPTPMPTPTPTPAPWDLPGWNTAWHDEFDGPEIDRAKWTFDIGGHGWGNNEMEYYTDRPENARIEAGSLVIEARAEDYENNFYTSARLKTQGLASWTYGRIEARIQIPRSQGIWPAFWMLGDDIESVGWPASGEIDIMENIGKEPEVVHGTLHGPGYSGSVGISRRYAPQQGPFADDYHVYAIEWDEDSIDWFVDDVRYATVTPDDLRGNDWVFDHNFFIILNVAVGGNWPGFPDNRTELPQFMRVDYVRVYQRP